MNRIKELRALKGMTQEQLAEKIGTSKQQIGRLESSKRRLHDRWVTPIAEALSVHPGQLWEEIPSGLSEQEEKLRSDDADGS